MNITYEILSEKMQKQLDEYKIDEDILKLINGVEKQYLSIALYFAQKIDIEKQLAFINFDFKEMDNFKDSFIKDIKKNSELIDNLSEIAKFNNPLLKKVSEGFKKQKEE